MKYRYNTREETEADEDAARAFFTPFVNEAVDALPDDLRQYVDIDRMFKLATNSTWEGIRSTNHHWVAVIDASTRAEHSFTKIKMRSNGTINKTLLNEAVTRWAEKARDRFERDQHRHHSQMRRDALPEMYHSVVFASDDRDKLHVRWNGSGIRYDKHVHHSVATAIVDELLQTSNQIEALLKGVE